ncbi:MAG TPA: valine--tRNA ligase [Acidimicrobiales bacterium]|nr:valine--tRNA ligase [Acidimicrobiales bacterium]
MAPSLPDKPSLEGLEEKWSARWHDTGVYRFDRSKSRDEVYSIDTPPPTVSGRLHPGHVCSYTHTDITARYWRMRGKEVFYPMGWDDNSLNVVRRVSIHYGVTCDPTLPFDAGFEPPGEGTSPPVPISRPNFVMLCEQLTTELEKSYYDLWTRAGLSVDWTHTYTTIGARAQRASQWGFLRLLERGLAYTAEAPTVWDVDFRTAIAQAELEDRELPGAYHRIAFHRADDGGDVFIETTRPELIPACVALVAHPDDERYQPLFGSEVTTPLFGARVPVKAHPLADPEKGSGIAMICTFGDVTDVTWWRELDLPVRSVIGPDGRLLPVTWGAPGWEAGDADRAQAAYDELVGKTAKQAQRRIVEMLGESAELVGEPKPITHPVKFWENGSRPLEIITNRQWFIRNGGRDEELRQAMLARGNELKWHPDFMRVRYENWVNGLNGDWNITRQLPFGVPIPLWYPIDAGGVVDWENPILPAFDDLPVDPSTDVPKGYTEAQRDQPGGFAGDPNVMDTWATSSLSPQIVGGWADDPDLFEKVFPYDLRPQAHEIIRTWLFYTVLRSHFEFDRLPWTDAAISGFVFDPTRKKLSKSAGNAPDDPMNLLTQHGADAVRYWAAGGRPGQDIALDPNQFKIGRRLAIKILNASKFVLSIEAGAGAAGAPVDPSAVANALDRSMLARLRSVIDDATRAFDDYDYTRAIERIEPFFWNFCDNYLELVKGRAYAGDASALAALRLALSVVLRLFAPFLPYVTEEVWSWREEGSIHRASWPTIDEIPSGGDTEILAAAADVLSELRKVKTEAKRSMKTPIASAVVRDAAARIAAARAATDDLREAGVVEGDLVFQEADGFSVDATLTEPAA